MSVLFVPIESLRRETRDGREGINVMASVRIDPSISKAAREWWGWRHGLTEMGQRGAVGEVPQILTTKEGTGEAIIIPAFVDSPDTVTKFLARVYRGLQVRTDGSNRIIDVTAADHPDLGATDIEQIYKRESLPTMSSSKGAIRPEIAKFLRDRGFDESGHFLQKDNNPALGTRTRGVGSADPNSDARFDPVPAAQAEIDAAVELVRETIKEMIALTSEDPENPAVDYDEVLDRAIKAIKNRLGAPDVTDWSDSGPAAAQAPDSYQNTVINQLDRIPNGFELVKRWRRCLRMVAFSAS